MEFQVMPVTPLLDTVPHDHSSSPVRWPSCGIITHPLEHKDLSTHAEVHSWCTMIDHEMLPVRAEAGAVNKRPALQIHEDMISCAASAGHQLDARTLQLHVQQLSQVLGHIELNHCTLPLIVILVMRKLHAHARRRGAVVIQSVALTAFSLLAVWVVTC